MHACLSCFSVFKSEISFQAPQEIIEDTDRPIGIDCPTMDCLGQVIDLDELILPAIFVLNYKGYATKNCCSGHVHSRIAETYVMFEGHVELPDFPHGFDVDEREAPGEGVERWPQSRTIRKLHDSGDRIGSILLANKKLYDWTRGLPNLNEERMEQETEIEQRQDELRIMRMLAMGFSPQKQNIPLWNKKKAKKHNRSEDE